MRGNVFLPDLPEARLGLGRGRMLPCPAAPTSPSAVHSSVTRWHGRGSDPAWGSQHRDANAGETLRVCTGSSTRLAVAMAEPEPAEELSDHLG